MCIKKIISAGFLLILISGTLITSGCTNIAQSITGDANPGSSENFAKERLNIEEELLFMKDMLSEMKNQGKDISSPLETYRIARMQAKNKDLSGFKESLDLFYMQSNTIMVKEPNLEDINKEINI